MTSNPGLLGLELGVLILVFVALLAALLSVLVTLFAGMGMLPVPVVRALYPWGMWVAGPNLRTALMSKLALSALRSGRLEEAVSFAEQAHRASTHGTRTSRAVALVTSGAVQRAEGRLRNAEESFRQAMELSSAIGRVNRVTTAINVAIISSEKGDFEAARSALESIASLPRSGGLDALFLLASGFLHYLVGDLPPARVDLERGLEQARRHRPQTVAKFVVDLGYVELLEGRTSEAARLAEVAIDNATNHDPPTVPHALALQGEAALAAGDADRALERLRGHRSCIATWASSPIASTPRPCSVVPSSGRSC